MNIVIIAEANIFGPQNGQTIPVVGIFNSLRELSYAPTFIDVSCNKRVSLVRRVLSYFNPFVLVPPKYELSIENLEILLSAQIIICTPASMFSSIRLQSRGLLSKTTLVLNDVLWPMYFESLMYGLSIRRGGRFKDLLKGLLLPIVFIKELYIYSSLRSVTVQTKREKEKVYGFGNVLVCPNEYNATSNQWVGKSSNTVYVNVDFRGRRRNKYDYFFRNIWRKFHFKNPEFVLIVFGHTQNVPDVVKTVPGIKFVGYLDDLNEILSARLLVVPLEHSTGISNSMMLGVRLGLPTVVTYHAYNALRSWLSHENSNVFPASFNNFDKIMSDARFVTVQREKSYGCFGSNVKKILENHD